MTSDEQIKKIEKLRKIAATVGLSAELADLGTVPSVTKRWLDKFITNSEDDLKNRITELAYIEDPVLLQGETGTGKELLANALHGDRTGRFIGVNITALSDDLITSELFGHVKGSFTGALTDKEGLFEAAAGGTLFLDEIGDMPQSAQAKILRVLQEGRAYRVGSTAEYKVSCRIVCATHREPKEVLREDLYYRLATFHLKIKPLRERLNDVDEIFDSLDSELNIEKLTEQGIDVGRLNGNVRELQMYAKRWRLWKRLQ